MRALVALWFGFHLLVTLTKGVLSSYGFGFPLLLTTIHLAFTAVLSNAVSSSTDVGGPCAPLRAFGMRRVVLFSVVFVTSIVLNNGALHYG